MDWIQEVRMEKLFVGYLDKFLSLYFSQYPKDLIFSLFPYFESIQNILIVDIQAKYPQYENNDLLKANLFHLLEQDTTIEAIFYYRLERAIFLNHPEHILLPYLANLMKIKGSIV